MLTVSNRSQVSAVSLQRVRKPKTVSATMIDYPAASGANSNNHGRTCGAVMALGFMRQMTCLVPSSVSAAARHSRIDDFPVFSWW